MDNLLKELYKRINRDLQTDLREAESRGDSQLQAKLMKRYLDYQRIVAQPSQHPKRGPYAVKSEIH